jgi:hypothetical protein
VYRLCVFQEERLKESRRTIADAVLSPEISGHAVIKIDAEHQPWSK